jgi:hypothetical protein
MICRLHWLELARKGEGEAANVLYSKITWHSPRQHLDEEEHKKWLIERIDGIAEFTSERLQLEKEDFEDLTDTISYIVIIFRNSILGGIGALLTILLTLGSIASFQSPYIESVIVTAAVGGIWYFSVNVAHGKMVEKLRQVWTAHYVVLIIVNHVRGYLIGNTINLQTFSLGQLETLAHLCKVAMIANNAVLVAAYNEALKFSLLWQSKDHFEVKASQFSSDLMRGYQYYKNHEQEFKKEKDVLAEVYEIIEPAMKAHGN